MSRKMLYRAEGMPTRDIIKHAHCVRVDAEKGDPVR